MIYLISNQNPCLICDYEIATLKDCVKYCENKSILGLDIETTKKYNKYEKEGLDPYTSSIVMLQIGDQDNQYIIDCRGMDLSILYPILESGVLFVGHNLKFEYKHILHNFGIRLKNLYDTQIVEQVLYNGIGNTIKGYFSLEQLNIRYLNLQVDKSTRLEFLDIGSKPFTTKQILYGADDIINPLKIREFQLLKIEGLQLDNCISLEMNFIKVLGDIEYKGINFNQEKWLNTYEINLSNYLNVKKELDNYVIELNPRSKFVNIIGDLFDPSPKCLIQWSSSKQVIEYFKTFGFCPEAVSKTTGKLSYTVEAKELQKCLNDKKFRYKRLVKTYLRLKELEQSTTTFGKNFIENVNPITKRIHSDYKQILNTGRISSREPNLQNIPSTQNEDIEKGIPERYMFRYPFDAPEGYDIINADYNGKRKNDLLIINFYY